MKFTLFLIFLFGFQLCLAQSNPNQQKPTPVWTEADRKFLLDNLLRSKQDLINETKNMTPEQWNFKESPDRWSINQIVEHICLWELISLNDISVALRMGPMPDFNPNLSDSLFLGSNQNVAKEKVTTDFSKPFTYGVPLGNNEGKNNMTWLITMHDETIEHLRSETRNMRIFYINFGPNIHQKYMMLFQHANRHLNQIKKVKTHPDYPADF